MEDRRSPESEPSTGFPRSRSATLGKKILFSILPILILLVLVEIGWRCLYYQQKSGYRLALLHIYDRIVQKTTSLRLRFALDRLTLEAPSDRVQHYADFFNSPSMESERRKYFDEYETIFADLTRKCQDADAVLLVLYIPSDPVSRETTRKFFRELTAKHQVPFLDVTDALSKFTSTSVYLLPRNAHLSRFGNQIVANEALNALKPYLGHRSKVSYDKRPKLLGDLRSNHDAMWTIDPEMPYRVVTNRQGLRRRNDLSFPKPQGLTRILCVGDSFTFGPYLNDLDCYPQLLEQEGKGRMEAINAGIAGYTICDEFSHFDERGKYTEPDIVLLEVLDNDLYGLYPYVQKRFCRGGKYCVGKK